MLVLFFKQKTAYEMRISDWSSDVCSSDLHFSPLITHVSPSGTALVVNCVGSEPPSTSVIEKQETISLARSGLRNRSFCSSVPNRAKISLLPLSGAWHPNTVGPQSVRPSISFRWHSSTCPKPGPPSSGGRCRDRKSTRIKSSH